ncbi:MAG: amidohydrolase [Gemmatimonadetes bacterium]|nr:amidohydrolase [Gemmatimonadota bacterium]
MTTSALPTPLASLDALTPQLVDWRRHLHRHPELSFHEVETSRYIREVLAGIPGITVSSPTPTSVLGVLHGARPGPTIGVRADIDALPIVEETELPFRSTRDGVMHACGHDGHTAILLGLATRLAARADTLAGTVRFFFQHAEELAPGGGEAMVQAGVMDGVDQVIGLHLWATLPVGQIALIPGPAMASPDNFHCQVIGAGGHAAMPHACTDPIAIAAQVVTAWQQIVSRTVDPLDPAVVSVTQFIAGTAFNVIPNAAYLAGTVRTFDPVLRESIPQRMEKILAGLCEGFGATYTWHFERGYRAVVNDPALTARLTDVVRRTFGDATLADMRPSMGGEDFSAYQQRAPGVYAFVGAGNAARGIAYPHHHPRFDIDEDAMPIGLRYLEAAVLDLLGVA